MLGVRLVRVIAGALGLLGVTLAQLNLPSDTFWSSWPALLYVALALLMITAVHELLSFVSYFQQLGKIRSFDRDVRAVLSAGIACIEKASGAHWQSVGISTYAMKRTWRRDLRLVEDLRLGGSSTRLFSRWRPGKGVIGASFSTGEEICRDWETYFKESMSRGRTEWNALDDSERYGLSWGQLMRTEQLSWISAFPVFRPNGRTIGVVAVDAPVDLSTTTVSRVLRDVGAALGDVGKPPGSWWSYVARRND
jgi:hypothetical protein